MSKIRLGRKKYVVWRDTGQGKTGDYVDGEWVPTNKLLSVKITATIQGASGSNLIKFNLQGEREAEAIWIDSDQRLFMTRSQTKDGNLAADIIEYDGAEWEVRKSIIYDNIPNLAHCESIAFKINESIRDREGGEISCC